jgi:hypothetical protein
MVMLLSKVNKKATLPILASAANSEIAGEPATSIQVVG